MIIRPTDSIELVNRAIRYLVIVEPEMPSASSAIDALRDLADLMETAQGENEQLQICRPGRPRIEISENQLHFLVENNFRVKNIASIFHVQLEQLNGVYKIYISSYLIILQFLMMIWMNW